MDDLDADQLVETLQAVFRDAADPVAIFRGGTVATANVALVSLIGASDDAEIVGREALDLLAPQSRGALAEQVHRRVSGAPVPGLYSALLLRSNGAPVSVEIRTTPFRAAGEWWSLTMLRQVGSGSADELYRAVFATNTAMKLLIEPQSGQIVDANEAAVQFYGWSLPQLRAMTIHQINTPEQVAHQLAEARAGRRLRFQFRHRTARGEVRDVEVHSGAVEVRGTTLLLSIVQDVTDRLLLEGRLRETQRLETVGLVAAGVAHDFANLHTILLACAASVQAELPAHGVGHARIADLLHTAQRVGELANRLMEAAGARPSSPPVPRDLRLALESLQGFLSAATSGAVAVELVVPPGLPVAIDDDQLERVLVNLVLNARDASATAVRIEATATEDVVLLRVIDDGRGIEARHRTEVFEPFFTTRTDPRGHGLGLAAVRGIVIQAGGAVAIEPSDHGTVVAMSFPRMPLGPVPVLLVEDEPDLRDVLTQVLRHEGFEVHACGDAEEALALSEPSLRRFRFLVTDQRLPGRSGVELARELAHRHAALRVVLVSGDLSGRDRDALPARWTFVAKPFTGRQLADLLRR
jgi:PAS domain S-box-containing protein